MGGGNSWAEDVWKDVTSTYLTNADFEGNYGVYSYPRGESNKDRAIYQPEGWSLTYTGGKEWDMTAVASGDLNYSTIFKSGGVPSPTSGSRAYGIRINNSYTGQNLKIWQKPNLPKGSYKVTADCFKKGNGSASLYVNSTEVNVGEQTAFVSRSCEFTSNGEEIEIGLWSKHPTAVEVFYGCDNFKLEYNLTQALKDKVTEAEGLVLLGYTGDVQTTFANAIQTAKDNESATEVSTLENAITALDGAMTTYSAAIASLVADITDGAYYVYNVDAQKYLAPGGDWGTQATLSEHPVPFTLTKETSGKYSLQSVVKNGSDQHFNGTYCDGAKTEFTIYHLNENYILTTDNANFIGYEGTVVSPNKTSVAANEAQWKLYTKAQLVGAFSSADEDHPVDATFYIKNASLGRNNNENGWNNTNVTVGVKNGADNNAVEQKKVLAESYRKDNFSFTQTLSEIEDGLYRVKVQGFVRTTNERPALAYLIGGNEEVALKTIDCDGAPATKPGDMATAWDAFNGGTTAYANELLCVAENNSLTIGVKSYATVDWAIFDNFELEYLGSDISAFVATSTEYEALNSAIEIAEAKTLGFEDGEYAPYNNIDALNALATAKALDQDVTNAKASVVALTSALTSATWTANDGDVAIVYNGDMLEMDGTSPKGWNGAGWGAQENAVDGKKVYYFNSARTVQYGTVEGYTMPLKAATVYQLTYSYGSQGNNSCKGLNVSVKLGNEVMEYHDFGAFGTLYGTALKTVSMKFTTTEAGNYTLNFPWNGNVGITDVRVVKVAATDIAGTTVAAANGWGTFISPVEREIPAGMKAYTCERIENETTLVLSEASSIAANTAYILENPTGADVTIPSKNAIDPSNSYETHTTGLLTGVYAETNVEDGWYVLQNNNDVVGFYQVDTQDAENPTPSDLKVPANRAYLTVPSSSANVRAFRLDNNANAIEAISAIANNAIEAIYNANGVKVNALQKGINVVKMQNGKTQKVLVK